MREAPQIRIQPNWPLLLLFSLCLLVCGLQSALAQEITLHWSAEGMVGKASQTPMGEVLRELTAQSDIDIYIDPELLDTPVTFSFPQPTDTETALKHIFGPHNTAFVYTKDCVTDTFRILQVKIVASGKSDQSSLLHLTPASATSAGDVGSPLNDTVGAMRAAGYGQRSHLYGPSLVKPYFQPAPGTFGSTLPSRHDGSQGPDYRLNASQHRQVYEEIQQEKANLVQRTQRARQIDARTANESGKSIYRSQRNDALQAYLKR